MSDFTIKPATRQGVKPLVGFYGRSGSGKTMSALLFARGLVGPKGRIVLVDSENGRGSLFADIIPGGYGRIDLGAPFTPERYQEAITAAETGADCVVVDSLSHEWSGEGGVLDMQDAELDRMAGDNWQKREACKMAAWIKPKFAHKMMVMRLLRCKTALICCLRGEEKTHMIKDEGRTKVVTDEFSSPLFDQRFIFEMLLNFETVARGGVGGFVVPRKITHPAIAALLPRENEQITIAHGGALASWCAAPSSQVATSTDPAHRLTVLKKELWTKTASVRGADKTPATLEAWLVSKKIITPGQTIASLTEDEIRAVLDKSEMALTDNIP